MNLVYLQSTLRELVVVLRPRQISKIVPQCSKLSLFPEAVKYRTRLWYELSLSSKHIAWVSGCFTAASNFENCPAV